MARAALLNVMVDAARKAGRSLTRDFGEVENLQVSHKGPADFVSAADRKAEQILRTELLNARPTWGFLGEESGARGHCDNCRRRLVWLRTPHALARAARGAVARRVVRLLASHDANADADKATPAGQAAPPVAADDAQILTLDQARRFARLKELRAQIARRSRVAPSQIADDAALAAMARLDDPGQAALARGDELDAAATEFRRALTAESWKG